MKWENVGLAGAFVAGFIVATITVLRLIKAVAASLRDEQRKDS